MALSGHATVGSLLIERHFSGVELNSTVWSAALRCRQIGSFIDLLAGHCLSRIVIPSGEVVIALFYIYQTQIEAKQGVAS